MPTTGSWDPVALAELVLGILDGEIVGPVPSLLTRTDGVPLVYPGETHSLSGEPESGKGWIVLSEAARVIQGGGTVLYIDFEDSPASILTRLIALGVFGDEILDRFVYVKPDAGLPPGALAALLDRPEPFTLAVIDGLSEAYALLGLDYTSNTDIPRFLQRLVRPIAATGAATVQIDHVPKDKQNRGRYSIGGQHKLAGITVAYGVEVIDRPSRTQTGRVKLILAKDRPGHVPGQLGDTIALVTIAPEDDGMRVAVTIDPPEEDDAHSSFRPTFLMQSVSLALESAPGLSKRSIRTAVTGKNDYIDLAIDRLVAEGNVCVEQDGQARRHVVERPYREDADEQCAPVPEPCPGRAPGTGEADRAPVPRPLGGTGTVHASETDRGHETVPHVPTAEEQTLLDHQGGYVFPPAVESDS